MFTMPFGMMGSSEIDYFDPDLWLDATTLGLAENDPVSTWTGRVGSASSNGGDGVYLGTGLNSKPTVRFSANRRLLSTIANVSTCANLQIFAVLQTPVAAAVNTDTLKVWCIGDGLSKRLALFSSTVLVSGETITFGHKPSSTDARVGSSSYTRAANTAQILFSQNNTSGTQLRSNGVSVNLNLSLSMTASTDTSPQSLGYTGGDEMVIGSVRSTSSSSIENNPAFDLSEILIYVDKNLTADQVAQVESQLSAKWL